MGLLHCQARYLAEACIANQINGSLVTFGRLDFYFSFEDFTRMMVELKLAEQTNDELRFFDVDTDQKIKALIAEGRHMNTDFKNWKFIDHPIISDHLFYHALGFHTVNTIDISHRYGQVSTVFDLNQPDIKSVIDTEYDLVLDAGVMEHIFNVPQVLLHMHDLIKTDGHIIHMMPGNNTFDHGFYQFGPTLFNDYYRANDFAIKDISVLSLQKNKTAKADSCFVERWSGGHHFEKYDPAEFSRTSFGQLGYDIYLTHVCVQKQSHSKRGTVPTQYLFQDTGEPYPGPWA